MRIKIFQSPYHDPYLNLAYEDWLLKNITGDELIVFLYSNSPSIVLGRFQNPWLECDIQKLLESDVKLVRRQSGGGTVYHDLGNLNFSFIRPTRDHHKEINNQILIKALEKNNIMAYSSGRSDILVNHNGPKKISGAAFKQKKDRSFHHGTMLIDTKLDKLNGLLKSKHRDIQGKSIASNPAKVVNLKDLNPKLSAQDFFDSLKTSLEEFYQTQCEFIDFTTMAYDQKYFESLRFWDWLIGETPYFELSREVLGLEIELKVKKGKIHELNLYSEDVFAMLLNEVSLSLKDCLLKAETLEQIEHDLLENFCAHKKELNIIFSHLRSLDLFNF